MSESWTRASQRIIVSSIGGSCVSPPPFKVLLYYWAFSLGLYSLNPEWPPFAPLCVVHVQAMDSKQWSELSAETVSDTNCQASGPTLCYTSHQLLLSKTSCYVLDLDLIYCLRELKIGYRLPRIRS